MFARPGVSSHHEINARGLALNHPTSHLGRIVGISKNGADQAAAFLGLVPCEGAEVDGLVALRYSVQEGHGSGAVAGQVYGLAPGRFLAGVDQQNGADVNDDGVVEGDCDVDLLSCPVLL